MVPGWVYRVGIQGGLYRVPTEQGPDARGASPDSGAGPGSPVGAGVGGQGAADVTGPVSAPASPSPTLRARSVPAGPSLGLVWLPGQKGEIQVPTQ